MACCGPKPVKVEEHPFKPDFRERPLRGFLTGKFYARHEAHTLDQTPRVLFYEKEITKHQNYNPREHYPVPRYENQCYGWEENSKVYFYQNCDNQIIDNPIIVDAVREMCMAAGKHSLEDREHCLCKHKYKKDHWKIV